MADVDPNNATDHADFLTPILCASIGGCVLLAALLPDAEAVRSTLISGDAILTGGGICKAVYDFIHTPDATR